MVAYTSTQSGDWSDSATWGGGGVPGDGDSAIIALGHVVEIDGDITVGTNPSNDSTYGVAISGTLKWKDNPTGDWTLTLKTNMAIYSSGRFEVGRAALPIPAARTATVYFPPGSYQWIITIADGGELETYGADDYHRASATSVQTKLDGAETSGVNVAINTVDPVDWESGDVVWFSKGGDRTQELFTDVGGATGNWGCEKTTILVKLSSNFFIISNLVHDHMDGDWLFHGENNVVFTGDSTTSGFTITPTDHSDGSYSLNMNWTTIRYPGRTVGTKRAGIQQSWGIVDDNSFVIKNCLMDTGSGSWKRGIQFTNTELRNKQRDIDNLYIFDFEYGVYLSSTDGEFRVGTLGIIDFVDGGIYIRSGSLDIDTIYGVIEDNTPTSSIQALIVMSSNGGNYVINNLYCHCAYTVVRVYDPSLYDSPGYSLKVGGGEVYHIIGHVCRLENQSSKYVEIRNLDVFDSRECGIEMSVSYPNSRVYIQNCSFNKIGRGTANDYSAISIDTRSLERLVVEDCVFGDVERNYLNICLSGSGASKLAQSRIVVLGGVFYEPLYSYPTSNGVYSDVMRWAVSSYNPDLDDYLEIQTIVGNKTVELVRPQLISGTTFTDQWSSYFTLGERHWALVGGGGYAIEEKTHTVDNTFATRFLPYSCYNQCAGNKACPIEVPVKAGDAVSVSLDVSKNVSLPEDKRPILVMHGPGVHETSTMSDAVTTLGTWETLTVSVASAPHDGMLKVWLLAGKNLEDTSYGSNNFTSPQPRGTVIVIADGLSVNIS